MCGPQASRDCHVPPAAGGSERQSNARPSRRIGGTRQKPPVGQETQTEPGGRMPGPISQATCRNQPYGCGANERGANARLDVARRPSRFAQQARSNSALRTRTNHHTPALLVWCKACCARFRGGRCGGDPSMACKGSGVQIPSAPPGNSSSPLPLPASLASNLPANDTGWPLALPRCRPARPLAWWPITSSMTRAGCRRPPAKSRRCAESRGRRGGRPPPAADGGRLAGASSVPPGRRRRRWRRRRPGRAPQGHG
jgi:hypothetical protein